MLWQLPTVFPLLRHVGGQYEQLARQLLEEECSEEARKDERLVEVQRNLLVAESAFFSATATEHLALMLEVLKRLVADRYVAFLCPIVPTRAFHRACEIALACAWRNSVTWRGAGVAALLAA